jgi:hypothetical protein
MDQMTSSAQSPYQDDNVVELYSAWICARLLEEGKVEKRQFLDQFSELNDGQRSLAQQKLETERLGPHWNRIIHTVKVTLKMMNVETEIRTRPASIVLKSTFEPSEYPSKTLKVNEDYDAKVTIGGLVAKYLKKVETSVFLGSGSTVYHVARKMCDNGPYQQRFATVNIPVANLLCKHVSPPISRISIPEAVLETGTCRFATMQKPGWTPATVIVGADGCHYNPRRGDALFYAMDESIAQNTNLFVQDASDLVIVCLTSLKIGFGRDKGPLIYPPPKGVRCALVTDKMPHPEIEKAFKKDGWVIITQDKDWEELGEPAEPEPPTFRESSSSKSYSDHKVIPFNP